MTLFDIIRNLQAIAAQEPSVRSVSDGDIYDALNAAVDIRYGCFHITQDTHTTNGDLDVWGLNLFYIDRLLDNGENRLSIQSAGITILENVLKRFADTFGAEYMNNIVYTPFTQRFKDNCAGVFCKISVSTVMDNLCAEGGKIVLVKNQDKSIDITSNGRYNVTPDYGFSGLGSVDINVDVQGGEPLPPIEPVLQEKSIDIAENGSYSVSPDAGVDGLNNVNINVDVPIPSVYVVPNGMVFRGSSFNTFPTDGLDFSQRTSLYSAWEDCSLLTEFPMIDTSNCTDFMSAWHGCYSLKSFPALHFSKGETFDFTWEGCSSLTEFPALDLHNGSSIRDAWIGCSSLTTLGGFGAIKESFSLSDSPKLTVESIMNVVNQAADLNILGITGKTMTFGSTNLAKLTDAQKAVATNKGWTLA